MVAGGMSVALPSVMIGSMNPEDLLKGRTRETQIRRDALGNWWNGEDPISHPILKKRFDGWVDKAEDGRFCLSNEINWAYIALEGPAYWVQSVEIGDGVVELLLSGERREALDPSTLAQSESGELYCMVRDGRCHAIFENHAAVQLMDHFGEDDEGTYLDLFGEKVRIPIVDLSS